MKVIGDSLHPCIVCIARVVDVTPVDLKHIKKRTKFEYREQYDLEEFEIMFLRQNRNGQGVPFPSGDLKIYAIK